MTVSLFKEIGPEGYEGILSRVKDHNQVVTEGKLGGVG